MSSSSGYSGGSEVESYGQGEEDSHGKEDEEDKIIKFRAGYINVKPLGLMSYCPKLVANVSCVA